MKKSRNLIITVSLLIGLAIVFMASAHKAENKLKFENPPDYWSLVSISWGGDCVYPDDNTTYVVNLKIWDECNDPYNKVYDSTKFVSTDYTNTTFCIENCLCDVDEHDNCIHVIATVAKVNNTNNSIICSGTKSLYTNCSSLMGSYNVGTVNLQ